MRIIENKALADPTAIEKYLGDRVIVGRLDSCNGKEKDQTLTCLLNVLAFNRPELKLNIRQDIVYGSYIKNTWDFFESKDLIPKDTISVMIMYCDHIPDMSNFSKFDEFQEIRKVGLFFEDAIAFSRGHQRVILLKRTEPTYRFKLENIYKACSAVIAVCPEITEMKPVEKDSDEWRLFQAIKSKDSDLFEEIVDKFSAEHNLEEYVLLNNLNKQFEKPYSMLKTSLKTEIDRKYVEMQELLERAANLQKEVDQKMMMYNSIKCPTGRGEELAEYLRNNDSISRSYATKKELKFEIIGDLTYWDYDYATDVFCANYDVLDNVYYDFECEDIDIFVEKSDMKMLLKSVFVDEKIKMRVGESFRLVDGNMIIVGEDRLSKSEVYPNPHLNYFTCLGSHELVINESLRAGNIIQAIDQCIAATLNFNLEDNVVMEKFIGDINDHTYECFVLPNGAYVNAMDAVKWLKEDNNG